jgi:thioredoxin 2
MDLYFRCSSCGGINRVPSKRLTSGPTCGRCKATLATEPSPVNVDDAGLAKLVRQSPVPVLVDFWAAWCAPCRAVAPHLVELAKRKGGRLIVAKVDTEKHPHTAASLGVRAIPTLAVYKGGKVVRQQAGALMGRQLDDLIDPWLD